MIIILFSLAHTSEIYDWADDTILYLPTIVLVYSYNASTYHADMMLIVADEP